MKFSLLTIFIFLFSSLTVLAFNNLPGETNPKLLLEIHDKYHEVKFGITEKTVYMELSPQIVKHTNKELSEQHYNELESFVDSGGEFIMGNQVVLRSNRIEYDLNDIKDINFINGKLQIEYSDKSDLSFEDVSSINGKAVLENFYIKDLELFALTYHKHIS